MLQQTKEQLFYKTEAAESTDVPPPVTTTTAFWGGKNTEKTLRNKIYGFHFTIHQETPCGKIIRLWHNLKRFASIGNFIRTRGLDTDISFLLFSTLAVNMKTCPITPKFLPQGVKRRYMIL